MAPLSAPDTDYSLCKILCFLGNKLVFCILYDD